MLAHALENKVVKIIVMYFTVASSECFSLIYQLFLTNFLYLFPFLTYILLSILLLS